MKRRANGEGAVYRRRDGRWEGRVSLGDGGRRSLFGKTQREVLDKLRALEREQERGLPLAIGHGSVGEFLAGWLESSRPRVRLRTWIRYEQLARVHTAAMAKLPLAKLGPQHLERLYAMCLRAGAAPMTVRHLHALLHKAMDQAEKWGLVARNVVTLVSPPRATHQEMRTLNEEQTRAFLAAVSGDRLSSLYLLAVTTGMRQGEILALRWRDVDLDHTSVQIQQTIQSLPGSGYIFTSPKTVKSRRKVELTNTMIGALRQHRTRQIEERFAAAGGWHELDLVFTNEVGLPIRADRLRWNFQRTLVRANLPRIRFHDLRHTAATLLLGRGVHPKIVSEMLGHSTIAITLDTYSHVTPTMQRAAAAAMDVVLGG